MIRSLLALCLALTVSLAQSQLCDVESRVNEKGVEHVMIPLKKVDCGSLGCLEMLTESKVSQIRGVTKTCMSLVASDSAQSDDVMDLKKCNSVYEAKVTDPQTNQVTPVTVNLKCALPRQSAPGAKFCEYRSSMSFMNQERVLVNSKRIECPVGQCIEAVTVINTPQGAMTSRDKNCASYVGLDMQPDGPEVIDLRRCNSNYQVSIPMPQQMGNQNLQASVSLKCFPAL